MQGLLVLVSLTVASAQVISHAGLGYAGYPYGYSGLGLGYTGLGLGYTGYPYGYNGLGLGYGGLGFPYTFGANILKPAAEEAEEGEARKKRDADAQIIPYSGLGYAGYPYGYTGLGLGYAGQGLGYTGYPLGYNGLGLGYGGLGFPYTFGANILKPAAKEAEEGADRKKRDADAQVISHAGLGYAGYPYGYTGLGLGYTGLGLGYTGYPYGYSGLGLGYGGLGFPYTLGANILKPAVEKVEEGEARKKRDADAQVIPYAGLGYAGYPYGYTGLGLGYTGYPYGYTGLGLGYGGFGFPYTYGANILRPAAKEAEE